MKKLVTCILLFALAICQQMNAQTAVSEPSWVKTLRTNEIIDSVIALKPSHYADSIKCRSYHIYYHQPLCHDDPNGETFQLRCALVVCDTVDVTRTVNEVYFSGYGIDDEWNEPDSAMDENNVSEIAQRYDGNLIMPEHRYFSHSSPVSCWERLDYCNASEASQDFHALVCALKTVFRGKWAMTGISKGGITAAMQHAFFPEDADVYVPNSAPFCRGLNDPRMHRYIASSGWTEKSRARVDSLIRSLLEDSLAAAYYRDSVRIPFYRDTLKVDIDKAKMDSLAWMFYYKLAMEIGIGAHADVSRDSIDVILDRNEELKQTILETYKYFSYYFPTLTPQAVLDYLYVQNGELDAREAWKELMPETGTNGRRRTAGKCFGITEKQWRQDKNMAYNYQAARELGRYGLDFRNLYEEGSEMYSSFAEPNQLLFEAVGPITYSEHPFFLSVKYDDHALFDMVEEKTRTARKPIYFVYGEDDSWTGAAMEDEFINGDNVRKYILAGQKHGVTIFSDETDGKEIMDLLDNILYYNTDDIEEVAERPANAVRYNMLGQRVSGNAALKGLYISNHKKYFMK